MPPRPESFPADYQDTLHAYLAAGGDPAELSLLLESWEALPLVGESVLIAELTGEAGVEIAVSFIDAAAETFPPVGMMQIYSCEAGQVQPLSSYLPAESAYPYLVGSADLIPGGVEELVFADVYCGAHTCWHTVHVWMWTGLDFEEQLPDGLFSLPYADLWLEDGQILGTSGGIGSVGAGPQRPQQEIWAWNGSTITQTATFAGPSEFRYHAFTDGDKAFWEGDYAAATEAYLRVLNDAGLHEYGLWFTEAEEQLWLQALAQWRLLNVALKQLNNEEAETRYQQLGAEYPPEQPGYQVFLLAESFWTSYLETGDLSTGCLAAVEGEAAAEVLNFLNSFGYANPPYIMPELCPFLEP